MPWLLRRSKKKNESNAQPALPESVKLLPSPPARRVLLIDDDERIRLYVSELLASEGYAVQGAGDADSAELALERFKPELILLDIMIPGMDGQEISYELRRHPATRNIPLILVSGDRLLASKAAKVRADAYLSKPFDADDLLALVARFLQPGSEAATLD